MEGFLWQLYLEYPVFYAWLMWVYSCVPSMSAMATMWVLGSVGLAVRNKIRHKHLIGEDGRGLGTLVFWPVLLLGMFVSVPYQAIRDEIKGVPELGEAPKQIGSGK